MTYSFRHISTNFAVYIAIIISPWLTGCFTGIESTPKITANDVRKHTAATTEEDSYLSDIKPQPFADWLPGKEFYVTDDKISLIFIPEKSGREHLSGQSIRLSDITEVTDIKGEQVTELTFLSQSGTPYVYRHERSKSKLMTDARTDIPFTIEKSIVDETRRKLKGNRYYTVTAAWLDTTATPRTGRKFIPVTVTEVLPGNTFHPVVLLMADDEQKPFMLYLSVGDSKNDTRSFARLFSINNPRLRYPSITDEVWQLIINGKVAADMTRDECRLALGMPDNVDRSAGYNVLREIWSYANGKYLIFEDGILRNYRQ
ncbi:MAG: hypothetical protein K2M94_00210 [Paramuribaculum sp.]|nr:hypothetical protein [Paramuribaculum sp.]